MMLFSLDKTPKHDGMFWRLRTQLPGHQAPEMTAVFMGAGPDGKSTLLFDKVGRWPVKDSGIFWGDEVKVEAWEIV